MMSHPLSEKNVSPVSKNSRMKECDLVGHVKIHGLKSIIVIIL